MNRCLSIAFRFGKKGLFKPPRMDPPSDLKKDYTAALEEMGIKLENKPIIDNHNRGFEKTLDEALVYELRIHELRNNRQEDESESAPEIDEDEDVEEDKEEIEIIEEEGDVEGEGEGEGLGESEAESQPVEVAQKAPPKVARKYTSHSFKLKKVKNQKTFQSPTGQISDIFYNKYIQEKNEIEENNDEIAEEYMKGESKIDRHNADPRYRTKVRELMNMYALEREEEKLEFDQNVITRDPYQTIAKLNRYRKEIEFKEEKGDAEAFWDLVEQYPGSRYGPLPEDDPEHFYKYIKGRVPGSVKEKYRRETGEFLIDEDNDQQNPKIKEAEERKSHSYKKLIKRSPLTFRSILSQSRFKEEEQFLEGPKNKLGMSNTFNVNDTYLPLLPEFEVKDYQSNWQIWLMWQKFRYYYSLLHQDEIFTKVGNFFEACDFSVFQHKPLGSLYNYYKTLPKFLQEHEGVRTVYLGLQYKSPEWSISEKQQALNKAALMCLPLEQACDMMLQQHFSMDKYRLSAYQIDRIHNIKPEFTYDADDFFNEIKEEKLRGDKIGDAKNLPKIDEYEYGIEKSDAPSLPVDFYDNGDGFWDNYIKGKSNAGAPVMRGRQYFRH